MGDLERQLDLLREHFDHRMTTMEHAITKVSDAIVTLAATNSRISVLEAEQINQKEFIKELRSKQEYQSRIIWKGGGILAAVLFMASMFKEAIAHALFR